MRWPWSREKNRGTLYLLPDGRLVLGWPVAAELDQDQMAALRAYLDDWLMGIDSRVVVLPFPVDVTDLRPRAVLAADDPGPIRAGRP